MRFYNREHEIKIFNEILENAENSAQFTVVVGRRRIGKTSKVKNQPQFLEREVAKCFI
jgi:AAA+ ATPase superfamily predicted ATPase